MKQLKRKIGQYDIAYLLNDLIKMSQELGTLVAISKRIVSNDQEDAAKAKKELEELLRDLDEI